jgi:hypothetical protein
MIGGPAEPVAGQEKGTVGGAPMGEPLPEGFDWPPMWRPLTDSTEAMALVEPLANPFREEELPGTLEAELRREVCPAHPLHGVECRAVARNREDFNEFLFATARPDMPLAFVHLTWAVETTATFPYTIGYPSWEAFRAAWVADEE